MNKASFLKRYEQLGYAKCAVDIKPALRINTLKIDAKDLLKRLNKKGVKLKKIPYLPNGYWYESKFSLGATPEYLQGYYYLQGAASQLPVEILDPKPGELVLDMAAAPGSKSTQIGQKLKNEGVLICLDLRSQRLIALRNNLERCRVQNVIVYRKDARFVTDLKKHFDKILLDAPCSGNFATDPEWHKNKSLDIFTQMARVQKELLKAAWKSLKTGGTLVYSTCSLEPEENELIIEWFLGKYPKAKLEKINLPLAVPGLTDIFGKTLYADLAKTARIWPGETEGFFIAKLKK